MRFFRCRAFAATNGVSLAMTFGIFGSIFLLAQFFQTVQGYSPLEAGLRTLPWTVMPMFVAPVAGILSDRHRLAPADGPGLFLQAAARRLDRAGDGARRRLRLLVPAFVMGGTGMALVFAPAANAVLGAVRPEEAGQASGATNAIRELGGVLGVAVLAAVFTGAGGFESPQAFIDGLVPALWVGAAVLAAGGADRAARPGQASRAARRGAAALEADARAPARCGGQRRADPSKAVLSPAARPGIGAATAPPPRRASAGPSTPPPAGPTPRDLEAAGCRALALDVTDEDSMRAAVDAVERGRGAVGVLVNNAGYSQSGAVESVPIERRPRAVRDERLRPRPHVPARAAGHARAALGQARQRLLDGRPLTFPGGGLYHARSTRSRRSPTRCASRCAASAST